MLSSKCNQTPKAGEGLFIYENKNLGPVKQALLVQWAVHARTHYLKNNKASLTRESHSPRCLCLKQHLFSAGLERAPLKSNLLAAPETLTRRLCSSACLCTPLAVIPHGAGQSGRPFHPSLAAPRDPKMTPLTHAMQYT